VGGAQAKHSPWRSFFFSAHLWQFDSNSKDANGNDHARDFESDSVGGILISSAPAVGVKEAEHVWSENDADNCCYRGFAKVQLLLDEEREHAEQHGERAQDGIRQMGRGDIERMESHGD
jgi:hypothetical protein